jgi:hypothetical protein
VTNTSFSDPTWIKIGQDIDGEAAYDNSGFSVSLNAKGNIVAIGAISNNSNIGHVRVYAYDSCTNVWIQLSNDIDGEVFGDKSGFSVSLNAEGNIVAIGAPYNDSDDSDNGTDSGHVRVYKYNNNPENPLWIQMGGDIDGEGTYFASGSSVSLNAEGNIVAIGSPGTEDLDHNEINYIKPVRVYKYNQCISTWEIIPFFDDIEDNYIQTGIVVSLNSQGNIVAVVSSDNDGAWRVKVFKYYDNITTPQWIQMGPYIPSSLNITSVSLNAEGNILAIGFPYYNDESGLVIVYKYNECGPLWEEYGININGNYGFNWFGYSVSLNDYGNIVAIGAFAASTQNGQYTGEVRIYKYNENTLNWTLIDSSIIGESANNISGYSVSLNAEGNIVAIGATQNSDNGDQSGHVRVYELKDGSPHTFKSSTILPISNNTYTLGSTNNIWKNAYINDLNVSNINVSTSLAIPNNSITTNHIQDYTITGDKIACELLNAIAGQVGVFEITNNVNGGSGDFYATFRYLNKTDYINVFEDEHVVFNTTKYINYYLPSNFVTLSFQLVLDKGITSYSLTYTPPENGILNDSQTGAGRIEFNIGRNIQHYLEVDITTTI